MVTETETSDIGRIYTRLDAIGGELASLRAIVEALPSLGGSLATDIAGRIDALESWAKNLGVPPHQQFMREETLAENEQAEIERQEARAQSGPRFLRR